MSRQNRVSKEAMQAERKRRRDDIDWTLQLESELKRAKGKGGKSGRSDSRTFTEMTRDEQWCLRELWTGQLHRRYDELKAGPIVADRFVVGDD